VGQTDRQRETDRNVNTPAALVAGHTVDCTRHLLCYVLLDLYIVHSGNNANVML